MNDDELIKEIVEMMDNNYSSLCPPSKSGLAKEIIAMVRNNDFTPSKYEWRCGMPPGRGGCGNYQT